MADGWKEKHAFVLDEPGFEKYRAVCDVQVKHVDKPEEANTKVTAQWVPPGAPRLRSSVGGGGATAELDARDVDEPETHKLPAVAVVRQIGPFDYDSSELNPAVLAGIDAFKAAIRATAGTGPAAGRVAGRHRPRLHRPGELTRFDPPQQEARRGEGGRGDGQGA